MNKNDVYNLINTFQSYDPLRVQLIDDVKALRTVWYCGTGLD